MSNPKQKALTQTPRNHKPHGAAGPYSRTRLAARNGISSARSMMGVIDAICIDHAEGDADIDPNLIYKGITKMQGLAGLAIRAAAEARRNPQFKNTFFLTA